MQVARVTTQALKAAPGQDHWCCGRDGPQLSSSRPPAGPRPARAVSPVPAEGPAACLPEMNEALTSGAEMLLKDRNLFIFD